MMSHLIKIYAVCEFQIFVSGSYRVKEAAYVCVLEKDFVFFGTFQYLSLSLIIIIDLSRSFHELSYSYFNYS